MNIEKNKIKELVKMYFEVYINFCEIEEEPAPSGEYEAYNVEYLRVCDEEETLERVLNTLGITIIYNVLTEENNVEEEDECLEFYFEEKLMYRIFLNKNIEMEDIKMEEFEI